MHKSTNRLFQLRTECCGQLQGYIETRNGQDCVFCVVCHRYGGFNAPKNQTGRANRSVTSGRKDIKPAQRMRILVRANHKCESCGKAGESVNWHIGHVISVQTGRSIGMSEDELSDDENLACMCDECNLGLSDEPLPIRFVLNMIRARRSFRDGTTANGNKLRVNSAGVAGLEAVGAMENGRPQKQANQDSVSNQRGTSELDRPEHMDPF